MSDTEQCIRCDEPIPVGPNADFQSYYTLTFNQETGAFPLCKVCFDQVEDRDMWSR